MPLSYENLDATTRRYMRAELERDLAQGLVERDPRLTDAAWEVLPVLLLKVVDDHDDRLLAEALRSGGLLVAFEPARAGEGRGFPRRVPKTAAETIAEWAFNHVYVRAVCLRAIDEGFASVEVYRAKPVAKPRPDSDGKIGARLDPSELLADLRAHRSGTPPPLLGVPSGPNSGLSVRIPRVAAPLSNGL